ncbi:tellurite resistance TerB family protein [Acanthopleuribacter pedis]|uniref:TerB family tellurite resistance protein n=1 Tax=Acanthopleuribacter pedis TaxID=442870 RepID=A0A8J7QF46_9BACT|nr:TerB family tellurite resistance protein [Acanthopleuribacter pedis]MBO1317603.1 TerB family tellurite resistance protein [Acanthopleuribacter pedis]
MSNTGHTVGSPLELRMGAVRVLAKMALSDGIITSEERTLMEEILQELQVNLSADVLFEEVKQKPIHELIAQVDKYEDRFFIALRAYAMAHIDFDFDPEERKFFNDLVGMLQIKTEDLALIEATEQNEGAGFTPEFDTRLRAHYENSSFAV